MSKAESYFARIVRVFISYSHLDRKLAGGIKSTLDEYGMAVFLAHEDIEPTRQWQDVILGKLKRCDVFLPLLTKQFSDSSWVDQESGIAVAMDKFIIPVKLDVDPYGFIEKYQALKFDRRMYRESCKQIVKIIANRAEFSEAVKDGVIQSFLRSDSYEQANRRSLIVEGLAPYTTEQLNEIIRGGARNGQIYQGFTAIRIMDRLIDINYKKLNKKAVKEFKGRAGL